MRTVSPVAWFCLSAVALVLLGGATCKHKNRADLVLTGQPATYAAVTAGSPVTIVATAKNIGKARSTAFYGQAYLSKSGKIDATAVILGVSPNQAPLLEGRNAALAGWTVTIPGGASPTLPGIYSLIVVIDSTDRTSESNEGNNRVVSQITILSGTGTTDLSVTDLTLSHNTLTRGQSINATWGFVNLGDQANPPTSDNGFYLSTDAVFDGSDIYLGVSVAPDYSSGSVSKGTSAVTVPPTVAAGSYFILFVLDRVGAIVESNEINNVKSQPLTVSASNGVDYVVANTGTAMTVGRGGTFQVTPSASNAGATTATNAVRVGAYLSNSPVTTMSVTGHRLVGSSGVGPLVAGTSATVPINITIPNSVAPGVYYLGYFIDDLTQESESTEGNNGSSVITLTVVDDDGFEDNDVIGTAAAIPTNTAENNLTVIQGDDDWYQVTLGGGTNTLTATITNTVPGDAKIEIYDGGGSLIAAGAVTGTGWSSTISGLAAGNYYMKVYIVNGTKLDYDLTADTTSPLLGEADTGSADAPVSAGATAPATADDTSDAGF